MVPDEGLRERIAAELVRRRHPMPGRLTDLDDARVTADVIEWFVWLLPEGVSSSTTSRSESPNCSASLSREALCFIRDEYLADQ